LYPNIATFSNLICHIALYSHHVTPLRTLFVATLHALTAIDVQVVAMYEASKHALAIIGNISTTKSSEVRFALVKLSSDASRVLAFL